MGRATTHFTVNSFQLTKRYLTAKGKERKEPGGKKEINIKDFPHIRDFAHKHKEKRG